MQRCEYSANVNSFHNLNVQAEKTEEKDCRQVATTDCMEVTKVRQKEVNYQQCTEVTEENCKTDRSRCRRSVWSCPPVTAEVCEPKECGPEDE